MRYDMANAKSLLCAIRPEHVLTEYSQSANRYLAIIGPTSFIYRLDIVKDIGPISFCPSALSRTDILSDTYRSNIGQISL